jgi:heptosyltransferase-2
MSSPTKDRPVRLLVVAPNWLGDLVMATVLLEGLARLRRLPSGRRLQVVLCVRDRWSSLLVDDPRLHEMVVYERQGQHRGWRGIGRLAALWKQAGCDEVILLPPSLRMALTALRAGIGRRIGERSDGRGLLLTDPVTPRPRGSAHYTGEAIRLGAVWAQAHNIENWSELTRQLRPGLPGCDGIRPDSSARAGPAVWAFAPGATYGEAKTWPLGPASEFISEAVAAESVKLVLLGDASARRFSDELQRRSQVRWTREWDRQPGVLDLVGRTDIRQVVAILKAARLFVGNDSGLMHLAAALGTPTLGLFGSTSPNWTGPRGERTAVVEASGFACQPCFRRKCNQAEFCLVAISAAAVLQAASRLLGRSIPGQERVP